MLRLRRNRDEASRGDLPWCLLFGLVPLFLIARDTPGARTGLGTSSPIAQLVRALH